MLRSLDGRWKALLTMVAAFLCLVGLNVFISGTVIDISPLAVSTSTGASTVKSAGSDQPPLFDDIELPETLARPVFSPTRRDFVPASPVEIPAEVAMEQPSPEPTLSPPSIRFQGTRAVNGKFSALIATAENNADWFAEGANIAGWTIVSITADSMELSSGSENAAFSLYERKAEIGEAAN
ncbi:hypothetical protein [Neorhizobium sp. DT-125]|uniref:hypothetical protein n=1 Tax=Neorhizobium sp. DT-125 TaxID=3396163 RepID=UPI003F1D3607